MNRTPSGRRYFVTGTDTAVGKTRVTVGLLAAARALGATVAGMKPVAAGAIRQEGGLFSDDALRIAAVCSRSIPYGALNPFCLEEPVSPHIAADKANVRIDISRIVEIERGLSPGLDLMLIEGAGGWYCPIGLEQTMADVARSLNAPVILVVGLKLGCLNHARLSREAIRRSSCRLAGWIGSQTDSAFCTLSENLAALERIFRAAPLAVLPHAADPLHDAPHLRSAAQRLLRYT